MTMKTPVTVTTATRIAHPHPPLHASRPPVSQLERLAQTPTISEQLVARAKERGVSFAASDNISSLLGEGELELLQQEVTDNVRKLLRSLVIDVDNDHNTHETAERVAKMYLTEVFKGRYVEAPKITDFPNVSNLDQIYTVGPIAVRSACSHHLVPIVGHVWIGVHPSNRVLGLSKFNRLVDWVMSRPSIQEESTVALADQVEKLIKPQGLGIYYEARHMCVSWRGVRDEGTMMRSSVVRGTLREYPDMKDEFFRLIGK